MLFVQHINLLLLCMVGCALTLGSSPGAAHECLNERHEAPRKHPTSDEVADVIDHATLLLRSGALVRLTGIAAAPPPGNSRAKAVLVTLALNKEIRLLFGPAHTDRYGRALAHVLLTDRSSESNTWLQAKMIEQGMARVYVPQNNRMCVKTMLDLENQARQDSKGLWSSPDFRVRSHDETQETVGTFQLVEGTVLAVAKHKNRLFLNFGEDWREDFTITVAPHNTRRFMKEIDPFHYEGKKVRVRGWVEEYNGPFIELAHPGHVEIIRE